MRFTTRFARGHGVTEQDNPGEIDASLPTEVGLYPFGMVTDSASGFQPSANSADALPFWRTRNYERVMSPV